MGRWRRGPPGVRSISCRARTTRRPRPAPPRRTPMPLVPRSGFRSRAPRRAARASPSVARRPSAGTGSSRGARRPRRRATARRRPASRPLAGQVPHRPAKLVEPASPGAAASAAGWRRSVAGGERREREPDERRERRPAVRRGAGGAAELLDRVAATAPSPGRRARAAARTGAGSARSARPVAVAASDCLELRRRARRASAPTWRWPNSLVVEVVEVERPLLRLAELVGEDRVHRPADDRALDLRARVDPDDGGRVVDRVEVVPPRAPSSSGSSPSCGQTPTCGSSRPSVGQPLRGVAGAAGRGSRPRASTPPRARSALDPAAHERHLVRRDEVRRGDSRGRSAGPGRGRPRAQNSSAAPARLPARTSGRTAGAPVTPDPLGGHAVQLDRLLASAGRSRRARGRARRGAGPCSSGCPSCEQGTQPGSRGVAPPARRRPAACRSRSGA